MTPYTAIAQWPEKLRKSQGASLTIGGKPKERHSNHTLEHTASEFDADAKASIYSEREEIHPCRSRLPGERHADS